MYLRKSAVLSIVKDGYLLNPEANLTPRGRGVGMLAIRSTRGETSSAQPKKS